MAMVSRGAGRHDDSRCTPVSAAIRRNLSWRIGHIQSAVMAVASVRKRQRKAVSLRQSWHAAKTRIRPQNEGRLTRFRVSTLGERAIRPLPRNVRTLERVSASDAGRQGYGAEYPVGEF